MEFIFISRLKLFTLQFTYSIGIEFVFLMASHHLRCGEVQNLLLFTYIFLGVHLLYMYPKFFVRNLMLTVEKVFFLMRNKAYRIWDFEKRAIVITHHDLFNKASFMSQLLTNFQQQQKKFPNFFQNQLLHKIYMFVKKNLELFMTSIFHEQFLLMIWLLIW